MPSIFTRIIGRELPASIVFEDAQCIAFLDINPANQGHVLVVPKREVASMQDLPAAEAGHIMQIAQQVSQAIRATDLRCEGINFLINDGAAAGQEVFHVHLHVIPRYRGDSIRYSLTGDVPPLRDELDRVAQEIRNHWPGELSV